MRHLRAQYAYAFASCGVRTKDIADTWDDNECPRCREIHIDFYRDRARTPDARKLPGETAYVVIVGDGYETSWVDGVYLTPEAAENRRARAEYREKLGWRERSAPPRPTLDECPGYATVVPWPMRGVRHEPERKARPRERAAHAHAPVLVRPQETGRGDPPDER